jgi:hypothetical protein
MSADFLFILKRAIQLVNDNAVNLIIVTGGVTREGYLSEAEVGAEYLWANVAVPVCMEIHSTTFAENVMFMRRQFRGIEKNLEEVYVIARASVTDKEDSRLRFLYRRFWPQAAAVAEFVGTPHVEDFRSVVAEAILKVCARLDPGERWILCWPKIWWRNWKPLT